MQLYESFKKYKELFLFEFEEYKFLFHTLNWGDYSSFSELLVKYPNLQTEIEDMVWEICVIEHNCPAGITEMDAGLVTSIAQSIFYHSGCSFTSEETIGIAATELANARVGVNDVRNQIVLAICEAFPAYKPEDVQQLTWKEILNRLVLAETILQKEFNFIPKDKKIVKDDSSEVFRMLNDMTEEQMHKKQLKEFDSDES
jgi:hypothetical protein